MAECVRHFQRYIEGGMGAANGRLHHYDVTNWLPLHFAMVIGGIGFPTFAVRILKSSSSCGTISGAFRRYGAYRCRTRASICPEIVFVTDSWF